MIWGVLTSAGLFTTTIHAQDFKDTPGDLLIGRRTFPIVHPRLSRFSMLLILPICSLSTAYIWDLAAIPSGALTCLALIIGCRFVFYTDVRSDEMSYLLYNVRMSTILTVLSSNGKLL